MSTKTVDIQHLEERPRQPEVAAHLKVSTPFQWLGAGVNDFKSAPGLSLLYGALFAVSTAGVFLLAMNVPWYAIAYLTGLVVLGPFMASGLYAASRDMERGNAPSITGSVRLLMKRASYLALFSLMLSLVMAAWIRISALVFAVKFNMLSPSIEAYTSLLTSSDGWIALSFFAAMGFLLVSVVFLVSAVAVPMILDKDADFVSSMQTSYRAVMANPGAMAVWALTIVAMTIIGIATVFIGFAVIFPILGYASWHSYRSLVK